ncbi:MAG: restriction endonuclease subunit S [Schwartzia sp.]|nr:restriction endonuclease subunit S [Schwartzia sp. (in: firmicutes)]MBR1885106.1 restriction endonuclease subunit S [Schwartzia sp. (in: firmicutes)]
MKRLLPELCDIQYGYAFDSKLFSTSKGVPLARIRDVVRGYSETYTEEDFPEKYIIQNGDILIGMDGEFNIARWKGGCAALNQRVCRLVPHADIDDRYLFYAMPSKLKAIEDKTPFVTVRHLSAPKLNAIEIRLPPFEQQRAEADRLDAINNSIALCEKILLKTDSLVKSRFIEMFGEPNEMDKWPCYKIEDIADVTVGLVIKPTRFYTEDAENGIKAFRSLNVREMHVNDSDWVYFSEEGNEQNKKSQLQKGDVLVVRSGYPGTSCVVTDEYVGCNAIDIMIARPKQDKINPYYLCAFNNFPHGMNQIRHGTGGAAQKHFDVGAYNKVTIPVPPMELQDSFVEFMQLADKSKLTIQKSIEALQTLKAKLMQEYFG